MRQFELVDTKIDGVPWGYGIKACRDEFPGARLLSAAAAGPVACIRTDEPKQHLAYAPGSS